MAKENLGMLNGTEYIVYNATEFDSAFHQLTQRIDELARRSMKLQKDRADFVGTIGVGLVINGIAGKGLLSESN